MDECLIPISTFTYQCLQTTFCWRFKSPHLIPSANSDWFVSYIIYFLFDVLGGFFFSSDKWLARLEIQGSIMGCINWTYSNFGKYNAKELLKISSGIVLLLHRSRFSWKNEINFNLSFEDPPLPFFFVCFFLGLFVCLFFARPTKERKPDAA